MSKNQGPEKPKRPKSQKLNLTTKQQWEALLLEVNKEEVPVNVLLFVTVNLKDGTVVNINIEELLKGGASESEVEYLINDKLEQLDEYIRDVDFHISVDSVANFVQPFVDKLLRDL